MWYSQENLPSSKAIISAAASFTATAFLFRTIINDFVPDSLVTYFASTLRKFSSQLTVVIEESNELTPNHIFSAANIYLATKLSPSVERIKVHKPEKEKELVFFIDKDQEIVDWFQGVKIKWILSSSRLQKSVSKKQDAIEVKFFELVCHKKNKDMIITSYLPYVLESAKLIREESKTVKLHTIDYNGTDYWGSVNLDHPATFDTIAMDVERKKALIDDLDSFVSRKEFYKRVGKAWKRGYLFYGPPGTGKSSLVAAMANYLKFDVYDLDLKDVQCDSDLRRLLIGTANRSILVIEDIDRAIVSVDDDKVTLAGLLNFIDGLWSSCSDERIIVFTTNNRNHLDPVLLRPGRMDVQIHMSYCTPSGFKTLAYNYLRIREHALFTCIEELMKQVEATPAEVAEQLMKSGTAETVLQGIIEFLNSKDKWSCPKVL